MCDVDECEIEPVVFVGVAFPASALLDSSVDDGVDRSAPVGTQRLGFCIRDAFELGLTEPITAASAMKGSEGLPFPSTHALAASWSWGVLTGG